MLATLIEAAGSPPPTDTLTLGAKLILGALTSFTTIIVAVITVGRRGQKRENATAVETAEEARIQALAAKVAAAVAAKNAQQAATNTTPVSNGRIPRMEAMLTAIVSEQEAARERDSQVFASLGRLDDRVAFVGKEVAAQRTRLDKHLDRP